MITKETARDIWNCYQEIETATKLLEDVGEAQKEYEHWNTPRSQHKAGSFELGVPMRDSGHRLFDVPPKLAATVIRAHIAEKQAELVQANEKARMELDSLVPFKGHPAT